MQHSKCHHPQPAWLAEWRETSPRLLRENTDGDKDLSCPSCRALLKAERRQRRGGTSRQKPPRPVDPRQLAFGVGAAADELAADPQQRLRVRPAGDGKTKETL